MSSNKIKPQLSDYIPLHVHTEYSLMDSTIMIHELMEQAAAFKIAAVAMTDHGNMFGAVEFYKKAKAKGIKPIMGCEVYVAPGSRLENSKILIDDKAEEYGFHLILLVKDSQGYKNLCSVITSSYVDGFYYKPLIDKEILKKHSRGLIALSACKMGEVPHYIAKGQYKKAKKAALQYRDILGKDNFYIEIQRNGLPEQEETNKGLIKISKELGIPLVATGDCHYLKREDAKAHDMLLCIQTAKNVKDEKRMRMSTDEFYFKSPDEMKEAFRDLPEAIMNTRLIAGKCNFEFSMSESIMPKYELPKGISHHSYLKGKALEGLKVRVGGNPPQDYIDRLNAELNIIKKMGYSSYFLVVWDFIKYARENGIPVGPGRGRVPASLVAYCLNITALDPLKYNLIFETFLNPERRSMPDIDVDFCSAKRDRLINYVSEKYGKNHVAQIITFALMSAKSAIRDVGRAMGVPYAEVDNVVKYYTDSAGFKPDHMRKKAYRKDGAVKEMIDIAMKLQGLSRHAETHAAGVVIAPESLTDFMPLYKRATESTVTTQFDMSSVESLGLLKFDFIGLETLTVLEKTVEYIKQQGGDIQISLIPLDDSKTFKLLSTGKAKGVFQMQGAGMRDILVKMQPNRFEDLIALFALYRPGPMAWIDDFIRRKKGEIPVEYELSQLHEILDETYGIIIYHEQIMMIANKIAGYSMGQADILRRAMGKRKQDEMEEQKAIFVRCAISKGIPEKKARRLFKLMVSFAAYSFNKSHAAAYAYLAYQTAYMKVHYPKEFRKANSLVHS